MKMCSVLTANIAIDVFPRAILKSHAKTHK